MDEWVKKGAIIGAVCGLVVSTGPSIFGKIPLLVQGIVAIPVFIPYLASYLLLNSIGISSSGFFFIFANTFLTVIGSSIVGAVIGTLSGYTYRTKNIICAIVLIFTIVILLYVFTELFSGKVEIM